VVEWHDDGVRTGAEAELPAGTRAVAADGPRIVAATDRALLGHDGGWSVLRPLAAAPLLLARQARRRSLLLLTADGTVIGGAVDPARAGTHRDPSWAGAAVCAYDETLGAVWLAHPGGRAEAVLARVEPWPPRAVYRVPMPLGVEGLTVSHNGEWLAVRRGPGADGLELYNVAGRRVFRPPLSGLDGRIEVAFTYDNRLAAVDARDRVVVVELPARVDVRAEHRDLADLEVFWEGRMEKAARVRKANGGRRRAPPLRKEHDERSAVPPGGERRRVGARLGAAPAGRPLPRRLRRRVRTGAPGGAAGRYAAAGLRAEADGRRGGRRGRRAGRPARARRAGGGGGDRPRGRRRGAARRHHPGLRGAAVQDPLGRGVHPRHRGRHRLPHLLRGVPDPARRPRRTRPLRHGQRLHAPGARLQAVDHRRPRGVPAEPAVEPPPHRAEGPLGGGPARRGLPLPAPRLRARRRRHRRGLAAPVHRGRAGDLARHSRRGARRAGRPGTGAARGAAVRLPPHARAGGRRPAGRAHRRSRPDPGRAAGRTGLAAGGGPARPGRPRRGSRAGLGARSRALRRGGEHRGGAR